MDSLSVEAIAQLKAEIASLLSSVVLPSLEVAVAVVASRVAPVGLGGFIALNEEPMGEIVGRSVDASVLVTVGMPTIAELGAAVDALSAALLTLDRKAQIERGFQRLALASMSALGTRQGGNASVVERELTFSVRFEHTKKPEESEGVIATIPMTVDVQ